MKYFAISARLSAVFAVAAGLGLGGATPARAFTVAQSLFVPAVELQPSQPIDAFVKISNVTANNVELLVITYNEKGQVVKSAGTTTSPITVPKNGTFALKITAPTTGTKTFHTVINVGTANAVVADVVTVDSTTGQMFAVVPASSTLPASQFLGSVILAPSQSAKFELSNATAQSVSASLQVIDDKGAVLKKPNDTIPANGSAALEVTAPSTNGVSIHAIITWGAASQGGADVMVLDSSSNVIAILAF